MMRVATAEPLTTIDQRIDAQKADDTCCLIYTSGTGGAKGVMLTRSGIHRRILMPQSYFWKKPTHPVISDFIFIATVAFL
ncbi:MAG: hypothetical protein CM15mP46_3130 [Alphaproteobacteria bacterium]|nr:MAG: hypothetical protein CM15mP46_3130 [Alphaproteobacteria bacterium]